MYRNRKLRQKPAARSGPPAVPQAPAQTWWTNPKKWVVGVVGGGVATAVIAMIGHLVTVGETTVQNRILPPRTPSPLTWTVSRSPINDCHSWTFPKPIAQIPFHAMASADVDETWALGQGGADTDGGRYTVTIEGTGATDVILRNVRLTVLSRGPAVQGPTIGSAEGCGGSVPSRFYSADLSAGQPKLVLNGAYGADSADQAYTVSPTDPEVFVLDARFGTTTGSHSVTYAYEIDWSQGATKGTIDIQSPNGKPFDATTTSAGPSFYGENGVWKRSS